MVLPTGGGKSVIAVDVIAGAVAKGARALVIGHRKELIDQFYVHLGRVGLTPGIMRGDDERTDAAAPVQVGTIQTLVRRDLPPADLVFVDEAHRCPGDSYARVLEAFPKATVIGLTATPQRLDGKPLRDQFDAMVEVETYSELIDEGAIVAPIVYAPRKEVDLSKVHTVAGDYNEGELAEAMMAVVGNVAQEWIDKAGGRQTVVFAVNIAHSREIVESFKDAGITRVAHLDGETPKWERERILLDLETGKLQVVVNVGVLCEGWDQPSVKCCVMACPTKSLTKWMQTAGRVLRPWCKVCRVAACDVPGHKSEVPVLLDHGSNVDRHRMPHEDRDWSLDGKPKNKSATAYRTCPACYAYVEKMPCPVCGHAPAVASREVKKVDGVLDRVNAQIKKQQAEASADPKRAFFDARVEEAKKKGYAPGWPSVKYKEKYDQWPSWAWSQSVKADFHKDTDWQERVAKRKREREFWEEKKRAEQAAAPPVEEPTTPEQEVYGDDLIPF